MAHATYRVGVTRDEPLATVGGCWTRGGRAGRLNGKTYIIVTATLFLVVAIIHLLRIIFGWSVEIGGLSIPFWASWLDVLVACSRIPRLHAEQVAQRGRPPVATNRSTMPLPWGGQFENHRAVPWILTSFKEHRSSRMDPILHVSCAPEPDAERIIGDGLNAGSGAPACSRQRSRQWKDRRRDYWQNVARADVHRSCVFAGNPPGSRYRCSHDGAGGGRSASAWLPDGCSLHDQLPGTGVL